MKMPNKKRLGALAGAVAAIGAAVTLVTGATLALFSAQATGPTNKFTGGTVVLTNNGSSVTTCTVTVSPGDTSSVGIVSSLSGTSLVLNTTPLHTVNNSDKLQLGIGAGGPASAANVVQVASSNGVTGSTITLSSTYAGASVVGQPVFDLTTVTPSTTGTCAVPWAYTGTDNAAIGADVIITAIGAAPSQVAPYDPSPPSTFATPTTAASLFDASANGLQLYVQNVPSPAATATALVNGVQYLNSSGSATNMTTTVNGGVQDLLINKNAISGAAGTLALDWYMPNPANGASNAYQGATVTFEIILHAVQTSSTNNIDTSCTVGQVCSPAGFSWS